MLSPLNPPSAARHLPSTSPAATIADLLTSASKAAYDRLATYPLGTHADSHWLPLDNLLTAPEKLLTLAAHGQRRWQSSDIGLLLGQLGREAIAALATVAVHPWCRDRRLLDLRATNVALRPTDTGILVGLRSPRLTALPSDPMSEHPLTEVASDDAMLDRLLDQAFGWPLPTGDMPAGTPPPAAMAALIATIRRLTRCGDRHLWGTAALAAANTLTLAGHTPGSRAAEDRQLLLSARPDLARTIELVTVTDDSGEPLTFAARRTCCLLYKLPDRPRCGTCSLRDAESRNAALARWHLAERRRLRGTSR